MRKYRLIKYKVLLSICLCIMVAWLNCNNSFAMENIIMHVASSTDAVGDNSGNNNSQNSDQNNSSKGDESGENLNDNSQINTNQDKKVSLTLSIDNKNKYDGMDKTYQEGYVPTISGGKAILVVPILCDGDVKNNTLKTSLSLGDTSATPFVIMNYEKDVPLLKNKVNGSTTTVDSYLIAYTLDLKADRVNGSYPVVLNIKGEDKNGNKISESITTYVNITDGKNPNAEPESVVDESPTFAPKVLVQSYEYSNDPVIAGDEITAKITLINTSDSNGVKNMTVTATSDSEYLTLLSDTDTLYIDNIGAGEKYLVTFKYKVSAVAPAGQYSISLNMDYADYKGGTYASSGSAKLNISQPNKVEFDPVVLPESMEVADVMALSCNAMNLGKGKIYNVRATLEVDGLIPEGTIFIGDVEPGNMKSGSTTVSVTSLRGSSSYGNTDGIITFIYEDENGQEYTVVQELSTTITSPFVNLPDPEEEDKPVQWWIIMGVIVLVLMVFVIAGIMSYAKRKRLEKEE